MWATRDVPVADGIHHGVRADELARFHPESVIAVVRVKGEEGVLYDASWTPTSRAPSST